jgi:MinD-like ATPase involved in chromosome partitioning or flagellar assembly
MIQKQVVNKEIISKEALQMANYNQQCSRKFNIKIMNYPEKKDEKRRDIFVKDIVKDKLNVKVDPSEIQAIYRIRGKIGEARPVIVKLVNSEVKYRIMRAKENLPKKENVRLVEDVTKDNMGLITRLRNCKEFESAWYFNCSLYGKAFDEKRITFDIFDDINNKIAKRH